MEIAEQHKAGNAVGITSVCSAHPLVLESAIVQAAHDGRTVLIEATSNQVDQTGGYTGMRPVDFRDLVLAIVQRHGVAAERVVLGGDHLGPNRWRHLPPEQAMRHAEELVRAYVSAGFTKIHVDCSFPCAGDPAPLTDEIVAERAARLIAVAERSTRGARPLYVIGTEVPAPGGERDGADAMMPTTAAAASHTLSRHREALARHRLTDIWPQVIALVVQPGVDFDHVHVSDYRRERATALRHVLDHEPHMVFEAHSTDYQRPSGLRALVEDHFAILKVGPALTFALREAMVALAEIESALVDDDRRSRLLEVIEERMLAEPRHWQGYFSGDERRMRIARRFSYSDRIRYYWPDPAVAEAQIRLLRNLDAARIPLPLLSQYLPNQYERVRCGELSPDPRALVIDRIRDVLREYARACAGFDAGV